MITKTIQINEITFEELADKVADKLLLKIETYLKELDSKGNDIYMTRYQTADFLNVDISTVHNWTKKGVLKSYGIGYRRYYNKKEIIDYLQEHRLR